MVVGDHPLAVLHLCRLHLQRAKHAGHGRIQLVDRLPLGVVAQPGVEQAAGTGVETTTLVGRGEVIHAGLLQVEALGLCVVAQAAAELHRTQLGRIATGSGQCNVHAEVQTLAGREAQLRVAHGQGDQSAQGVLGAREAAIEVLLHIAGAHRQFAAGNGRGGLGTDRGCDQYGGGGEAGHQGTQAHGGGRWTGNGWRKE